MGSAIERTVEYMKSALAGIKVLEVAEAWNEVWEDRDVRVVILTRAGDRHFCAGHNLAPRPGVTQEDRDRMRARDCFGLWRAR